MQCGMYLTEKRFVTTMSAERKREDMFLETKRLRLRPFEIVDFVDFYEYVQDEKLCRMIGWNRIVDEQSAHEVFDGMVRRGEYAIVLKSTGRVIGNFAANEPHPGIRQDDRVQGLRGASISFAISAQHQKQGYISEAMDMMLSLLFDIVGLDYVNGGYFDFNTASAAVHKKFGFHYFSTHSFTPRGGETVTVIEHILFREEFAAPPTLQSADG